MISSDGGTTPFDIRAKKEDGSGDCQTLLVRFCYFFRVPPVSLTNILLVALFRLVVFVVRCIPAECRMCLSLCLNGHLLAEERVLAGLLAESLVAPQGSLRISSTFEIELAVTYGVSC